MDPEKLLSEVTLKAIRSSGSGGQHVNKTSSAVRITHEPTGTVVQCQSERSQHRNRESAMKVLMAKLYQIQQENLQKKMEKMEGEKKEIAWGSQIRSYVLDQSRIKDLRTNVEISNTQKVLDGDLDAFIEASLKQGV